MLLESSSDLGERVPRAVWRRRDWCEDASAALWDLIAADSRSLLRDLDSGAAHLYHARGEHYDMWVLLRFLVREQDGGVQCDVAAIRGRGAAAGLRDLMTICRNAGVDSIICETNDPVLFRLYERAGFREAWRTFVVEIEK